jgi:hypothetical protein
MANHAALAQAWGGAWGALAGSSLADRLVSLNARTSPGPLQDVTTSSVSSYLMGAGALASIEAYAASPPAGAPPQAIQAAQYLALILTDASYPTFATSDSSLFSRMAGFVTALEGDARTGVSSSIGAGLLALAQPSIPWWQANGFAAPIGAADLMAAGLL